MSFQQNLAIHAAISYNFVMISDSYSKLGQIKYFFHYIKQYINKKPDRQVSRHSK